MDRIVPSTALTLFVLVTGCVADEQDGNMRVSWTIGLSDPSITECEAAGIETLVISLDSDGKTIEEEASCPSGTRTFSGIPANRYRIDVQGFDESGCTVYAGSSDGRIRPSTDGAPRPADVRLEPTGSVGEVNVSWRFEDGRLCGAHEVGSVEVTILSGDETQVEKTVDCEDGVYFTSTIPAGSVDIRVEATSGEIILCDQQTDLDLDPCSSIEWEAELSECY